MKKSVSNIFTGSVLIVLTIGVLGCDRSPDPGYVDIRGNLLELTPREKVSTNRLAHCYVDEMCPTDVIVAVNGYPLTKKMFDDVSVIAAKDLNKSDPGQQMFAGRRLEEFQRSYVRKFIGQRLLIDHAFAEKLVTTNEVNDHVQEKIRDLAKLRKVTAQTIVDRLKGDGPYFLYDIACSFVMSRVIDKRIPTKREVDDEFVETVQKRVEEMNAEASRTNDLVKARLADWRNQIIEKKLNFGSVARLYSQDFDEDPEGGKDGVWGEFEESEMDDPGVAAAVFALQLNAISDVLEDDNGYQIVKVLKISPPVKDESGAIVEKEKRKLSRIYIEKQPLLIRQTDRAMLDDLKGQMQYQAVNEYIVGLLTNKINTVVYPHGQNIYR